jgi:predicted nucleotidyltransferase
MLQVTEELIHNMTNLIVQKCAPQKVILFGSHARGTANRHSDLDFMIIEEKIAGDNRTRTLADLGQLFFSYDLPIDFLIYSPEEIARWKETPNHVIAHALSEGKVLYERH